LDEFVQAVRASAPAATIAMVRSADRDSCLPGRAFRVREVRDMVVLLHCVVTKNKRNGCQCGPRT
jgi:hypothetical protein